MLTAYPWHAAQWEQLRLAVEQERLAHALLLSGVQGAGTRQFALAFSRYLLCHAPDAAGAACEQCRSCLLHKAGSHPDLRLLEPEEGGTQIKVEAVRDLIAYLQLSNQYGRRKIAIIDPAEGMNRHAANSLLKTLEEPAESALLVLLSRQPARLPVTLRSRCQGIHCNRIDRQAAADWLRGRLEQIGLHEAGPAAELLELADGAPLKALELAETGALQQWEELLTDLQAARRPDTWPMAIAEKWLQQDAAEVLGRLLLIFHKMTTLRAAPGTVATSSMIEKLRPLAAELTPSALLDCHALTLQNHHLLTGTGNLNKQGLLEQVIVHWQSINR